ncbi:general secretion pathway protein GspE [beta proteobacterium AAP121]|nr:general secretion pathway protein GspE [beta proteobacterium AAP65]KPF99603.1 general secretion pathway protein GspE [beta proteobacterium AAP121]
MNAADGRLWQPDFDSWPPVEAARHRAVLGRNPLGEAALLADRHADPLLLEAAELRSGLALCWHRCEAALIDEWLAHAQAQGRALDGVFTAATATIDDEGTPELTLAGLAQAASPAVRLLDAVLYDALKDGASDVHLETGPHGAEVRIRLDGVMQPLRRVEGVALAEQMVSRLKVMAELDIGERRLPQDGRFRRRAQGRDIDFRVSIMPSVHGEDAVVRVLDRAAVQQGREGLTLASLGFPPERCALIRNLARQPHGMLLVTGPTGSGKTTTLYAAITEIHQGGEKIITIEDPVEYELAGVVQVPVNERKGLSFARGLRSILRHDPDRVLVGEIRDTETAQIAVQAALTGHLVFSTVHANHAFDVIGRFMHMGLDLYNVVSALNAVVAQRLVRRLCGHCAAPMAPTPAQALQLQQSGHPQARPRQAVGCPQCRHTGYRGRLAVAEVLVLDDELRDLIAARAPMQGIKQAARERGMQRLRACALGLVAAGETSFEELDRVVADD